jgi:hypothetical protein
MAWTEKYVTVSGGGLHDGSSEANAWTLAEAASNAAAGERHNIKAGTYTLTSNVTFNPSGVSTTSPFSLRGYKATIGDMDEGQTSQRVSGTDIPLIECTGFIGFACRYSYGTVENIAVEIDSPSTHCCYVANQYGVVRRCSFSITNSSNTAFLANRCFFTTFTQFQDCSFSSPDNSGSLCSANRTSFHGCYFQGGYDAIPNQGNLECAVTNCVFSGQTANAIEFTYGGGAIESNTFYDIGGNAIQIGTSAIQPVIKNNVFHTITGYAVVQSAGELECFAERNIYYNCTAGQFSNDEFSNRRNEITATSDPFVDAASNDFSLVSSSDGYNGAAPKPYDLLDVNSGKDIGAIQHADPSGGGGAVLHPLRSN